MGESIIHPIRVDSAGESQDRDLVFRRAIRALGRPCPEFRGKERREGCRMCASSLRALRLSQMTNCRSVATRAQRNGSEWSCRQQVSTSVESG